MENPILKKGMEADDLVRCCDKLDAIGDMVSALGFQTRENGDETLDRQGEEVGDIISDYAKVIKAAIEPAYFILGEFFKYGDGSIADQLKKVYSEIPQLDESGCAVLEIDSCLKKIKTYLADFKTVYEWQDRFKKLRKEIIDKKTKHRTKRSLCDD